MTLEEIGYFSKTHGIKGALVLKQQVDFDWEALKVLFVDQAGNKAPYFISNISKANQGFIVELEDLNQVEKAALLLGKAVFVNEDMLLEMEVEANWIDYEVIDERHGDLGKVRAESDNGQQTIIELDFQGRLVLLPLVEDFIVKIDEENRRIYYKAPEGLIDLYLRDDEEN
ncbi:MAG: hypothetical protein WCR21_09970 [Bacteroidota bacterium]